MIIGGIQKLTLLDFPGRVAVMIFTKGCNFRCPYCHNPELIREGGNNLTPQQVLDHIERRKFFLDGVVITGGEPTIHQGLVEFCRKIKEMGLEIKLDTNGSNPMTLKTLLQQGLVDYVAMDVKAGWRNYEKVTGTPGIEGNCIRSMALIREAGRESGMEYEFRTTIYPPVNDTLDIASIKNQMLAGENYYTQPMRTGSCLDEELNRKAIETVELNISGTLEHRARKTVELEIAS